MEDGSRNDKSVWHLEVGVVTVIQEFRKNWRKHLWGFRPFKRHGLILLIAGLAYLATGLTYIWSAPTQNRRVALQLALGWFPIEYWGSIFGLVGVAAIISSRWPPVAEKWGYMLLAGLSAGWSATYAAGVIFEDSPASNLTGALNWGLLAAMWVIIPGLVNPDKTVVVVINGDERSNC